MITGETPDISEWLDFSFYDRVWCYEHKKIEMDSTGKASGPMVRSRTSRGQ